MKRPAALRINRLAAQHQWSCAIVVPLVHLCVALKQGMRHGNITGEGGHNLQRKTFSSHAVPRSVQWRLPSLQLEVRVLSANKST